METSEFTKELAQLINKYSLENGGNTPDFLLANFLTAVLDAYAATVDYRDKWFNIDVWDKNGI